MDCVIFGSTQFLFSSILWRTFLLCFQQQRNPDFGFVVGVSYANLWLVYERSLPQSVFTCKDSGCALWTLSRAKVHLFYQAVLQLAFGELPPRGPCLSTRPVSSVEVSWLGEHRQAVSCRFGRRLYFRRLGPPPNLHSAEYLKCRLRVCTIYLYSDYVLFY